MTRRARLASGWRDAVELLLGTRRPVADALVGAALRDTRLSRAALDDVAEPLRRLLGAIGDEADLSPLGQWAIRWDVHRLLSNLVRLRMEEVHAPAIVDEPVVAPIFITGLPRSGTTFLHRLMAEDPASLVPRQWQTVYPYPDAGRHAYAVGTRERRAEAQLRWFTRLAPEIQSMHPIHSQFPQECIEMTAHVFQSPRFSDMYDIPSYQQWLDDHGYLHAYQFHKRFLQHLQAQAGHGRWVLKAPNHVLSLDALQDVYPDARLVFVHRDPLKVIPSAARLTEVLRTPFARRVNRARIGRKLTDEWARAGSIMVDLDTYKRIDATRVIHVRYTDLVAGPLDTVARIYGHFGLPLTQDTVRAMHRLVADNPRGGYGRNHYRISAYGITPEEIRDRFRDYVAQFGIPSEAGQVERAAA